MYPSEKMLRMSDKFLTKWALLSLGLILAEVGIICLTFAQLLEASY